MHLGPSFESPSRFQAAGHDSPHFCTDPLMATLAHFETDSDLARRIKTLFQVTGAGGSRLRRVRGFETLVLLQEEAVL